MAILLLWGTSGLSFSRMTCVLSGHASYSLGMMDDCCPEDRSEAPVIKATCCDFGSVVNEVDDVMPGHQLALSAPHAPAEAAWPIVACHSEGSLVEGWLATRPPPLLTQERLSNLRRLRI